MWLTVASCFSKGTQRAWQNPGQWPNFLLGTAKSFGEQERGAWSQSRKEAGYCGDSNPGPQCGCATTSAFCFFLLTFSQIKVKSKT